jgi:hypothetical protein
MKSELLDEAKRELRKSRQWYDKRQAGLGVELLEEFLDSLAKIERNPKIGIRYLHTDFRFHRMTRFPFVIYYVELVDHICIMTVAHNRRRPAYWMRRKPV